MIVNNIFKSSTSDFFLDPMVDLESVNEGDGRQSNLLAKSCVKNVKPQGEVGLGGGGGGGGVGVWIS